MIRITKQADYGTLLLTHFAMSPPRATLSARDLAKRTRLPLPTVTKILKLLGREGLLLSHRGVKGGYSLARQPHEISVAEIVTALDGPIAITQCCDNAVGCARETSCPVRPNWQRIDAAIRDALADVMLSELTRPTSPGSEDDVQPSALGVAVEERRTAGAYAADGVG